MSGRRAGVVVERQDKRLRCAVGISRTCLARGLAGNGLAHRRPRIVYVALALATIALGLGVHLHGASLGATTRDVLGDALWAAMMVWWVSAVAPAASLRTRAVSALALCFVVEVSQLYHSTLLDAWRSTTMGHLILGSGFDPRDLLSYTLGVLVTMVLALAFLRPKNTGME